MRGRFIASVRVATVLCLFACQVNIPEARFECVDEADCPDGWFCREDALCYETPGPDGIGRATIGTVHRYRATDTVAILDDGFEMDTERCTGEGERRVCVTGGIQP